MPQPTLSAVHVNTPLTNVSVAFTQNGTYAWNQAFPIVPSPKASNLFFTYDRDYWFRSGQVMKRAPGTESAGSGYPISTSTFTTDRDSIHKDIPDPIRDNADIPIDLDREAAEWTAMQLQISIERAWASAFFTTSVWNADTTPSVLWDVATSDPIADIEARRLVMKTNTGRDPNILILGAKTWSRGLKNHPDLLDRIKYTQRGIVTTDLVAAALGVDKVIIAEATQNTSAEGTTGSYSFIDSQSRALLAYAPPNPGVLIPAAGYTFIWTAPAGANNQFGIRTKKFRLEWLESDRVETEVWYTHVKVSSALGELFTGTTS